MAGFDVDVQIEPRYHGEAKMFIKFLQKVGRRFPVDISCRTRHSGNIYVAMNGTPGAKIDALLQELVLNKGLYYYACSVNARQEIARKVIAPIFQELLEARFSITHPRLLRRHVLGKVTDAFMPGEFVDPSAHDYERLFRRWDLQMISDYEFVRDLDDLLTAFMLSKLAHPPGTASPVFGTLVDHAGRANIIFDRAQRKAFNKIHTLRTRGLHRLERNLQHEDISALALQIYLYFEYFDDFQDSQRDKTAVLRGKRYRRIKYGEENWDKWDRDRSPAEIEVYYRRPCGDCSAIVGQYHCYHCDLEQCPRCGGQFLGCDCTVEEDELPRSRSKTSARSD